MLNVVFKVHAHLPQSATDAHQRQWAKAGAVLGQVTPPKPFLDPAKHYVLAEFPHAVRAVLLRLQ